MSIADNLKHILATLPEYVTLVAVSKTKPAATILEAYDAGHKVFGENKVQELVEKYEQLPKDIEWHMIGHLQRNKVKYMAHFVHLIHGVDSFKTLKEINKQGAKHGRVIKCLLQARIAQEETKFGLTFEEIETILGSKEFQDLENIKIAGLMAMASFTDNEAQIRSEFSSLHSFYQKLNTQYPTLEVLSIGMSGDYQLALENGSTMIRVGSAIFGARNYN
ncbi:MAG: YggS family pyridoxal phosphate-dependent enzyme [Flavobacteriaceae bacterium]|nr:YggS family pyridoxal phosphate-dependent enzyme [Flavobacteriaceae bacterium]